LKTQLQFGKLYITTVLANQKSQRQNVNLQGGAAASQFSKSKADEYEENRHFLVGQYFKNNYNESNEEPSCHYQPGADSAHGSMGDQQEWCNHYRNPRCGRALQIWVKCSHTHR
jgi:hypothetical protein